MTSYEFVRRPGSDSFTSELTAWETYRNHRDIVTGSILDRAPPSARSLCVFGAGLCLDVELKELSERFGRITLVDLTEADLRTGLESQGLAGNERIEIRGGVDLSGVHQALVNFREHPDAESIDSLIARAACFTPDIDGEFDCVASTCMLSQLLCHATACVSEEHPRFVELLQTIRLRHIQIMIQSLRDGGCGLLFTDIVSSESLPELCGTGDLATTVRQAISQNNFLHGLNPAAVRSSFSHESIAPRIKSLHVTSPWRWVMPDRIYACFAVVFELN